MRIRPTVATRRSRSSTGWRAPAARSSAGWPRGIDGIAHASALEIGGDTIGVLGTGLDVPHPTEHEELIRTVAEHGCLDSEFPSGTPPLSYHFPQRNRIIAGLARGVLVIKAPEKSGAMITAEFAREEGKEASAVPGPITRPAYAREHLTCNLRALRIRTQLCHNRTGGASAVGRRVC